VEHPKRTIVKTITWRGCGAIFTIILIYFYSGDVGESLAVGISLEVVKMVIYYLHERIWNRIRFGRKPMPEYQI